MAEWKFARRQDRCSACEQAFEDGARHVSALSIRAQDLVREDVCLPCWERREKGAEIFFWTTRRKAGRGGLRLDLPALEQLFLRLEGREEGSAVELRYVLCLLLMRKKKLKLVRVAPRVSGEGSRESLVVRRPRREEALAVEVCDFGPERLEELRRELAQVFEGAEGVGPFSGPSEPTGEELPPSPPSPLPSPCSVE